MKGPMEQRTRAEWQSQLEALDRSIKVRTLALMQLDKAHDESAGTSMIDWLPIECCPDSIWVEVMGWLTMKQSTIADMDGKPWMAYVRKINIHHSAARGVFWGERKSDWVWQKPDGDYLEHEQKTPEFWRPARPMPVYPRERNTRYR